MIIFVRFWKMLSGFGGGPTLYLDREVKQMKQKCEFRKKNGQRCGADAQSEKTLCVFHDPAKAAADRRAKQLGGINRSRMEAAQPPDTAGHPLNNVHDVSLLLGQSINQVRRGQLAPRVCTAVGYLAGILLSALQQGPLEKRLQRLETTLGLGKGQPDMMSNVEPNTRKQN